MLKVALVSKLAGLVCVEERRTVSLREAWRKKQFLARNVYNGASNGCLGSICFATITRLLLLSVIVIGEADIAITSFATTPLESRLAPPRRIPLTLLLLVSD